MKTKDLIEGARYWVAQGTATRVLGGEGLTTAPLIHTATLITKWDPDMTNLPWLVPQQSGRAVVWFDDSESPEDVPISRIREPVLPCDETKLKPKPCPHCGGEVEAGVDSAMAWGVRCYTCRAKVSINCPEYAPPGYEDRKHGKGVDILCEQEAIRRWNRRA